MTSTRRGFFAAIASAFAARAWPWKASRKPSAFQWPRRNPEIQRQYSSGRLGTLEGFDWWPGQSVKIGDTLFVRRPARFIPGHVGILEKSTPVTITPEIMADMENRARPAQSSTPPAVDIRPSNG